MDFMNEEGIRQSERIKEANPFINVYKIENEDSLTLSPAVVYKFDRTVVKSVDFDHEMERGNLTYAPSLRNPYYMSTPASKLTLLTGNMSGEPRWATGSTIPRNLPSDQINACFYVSLKLFYDMANDNVDWLSLSCLKDPQVGRTLASVTRQEAETLKEIAFGSLRDPPKKDPIDTRPYDPPIKKDDEIEIEEESAKGEPRRRVANKESNPTSVIDWRGTRKRINANMGPKTPRRLYIPIRHQRGWLIWIRKPDWGVDREARRGQLRALKKVFEELWMDNTATDPESAAGYRPRYSSVDLRFPLYVVPHTQNLKLRLRWQENEINTKFGELVKIINNRKSQQNTHLVPITDDEVNKDENKNKVVKMGENPFRLFTTYITADAFNTYMQGLEVLTDTALTLNRNNAHRTAAESAERLNLCLEKHRKPFPDDDYTTPQTDLLKIPLYAEEAPHGSTWRIIVSQDKLRGAGGNRDAKYAPRNIMGMSANEAADECFGWSKLDQAYQCLGHQHKLSNGMYMAEWLHLCAFSWGGLSTSPESTNSIYRTSDIPENLILGTSETNSVMTRFEKAWQTLVRDVSDATPDADGNSAFYAKLTVERNRDTEPVIWDLRNYITETYYREEVATTSTTERQIAQQFRFVAYTVSYSIQFPEGCEMLSMGPGESLKTTFYPFLRPLYHRLEDQLDQMLYQEIKARYFGVDISDSSNAELYGIVPTATDDQMIYDGTVAYGGASNLGRNAYVTQGAGGILKHSDFKGPYNMNGQREQAAGTRQKGAKKKKTCNQYQYQYQSI